MKILKCDLCNATREMPASLNDKASFYWAEIKEYDGYIAADDVNFRAHMCPDCFMKIKQKIQTEE